MIPLLMLVIILPSSDQRSFQFPIEDGNFGGKTFSLHVNTNIAEILLIDENCGPQSSTCSRYCTDGKFLSMFCPLKCQPYSPQSKHTICPVEKERQFSGISSPTAKHIADGWRRRFPGTRLITGQRWAEEFRYFVKVLRQTKWFRYPLLLNVTLISAEFFDRRLITISDGIMGLGPGPGSAAESMLNSKGVQNRLVSISMYRRRERVRLHVRAEGSYAVTVGGLDGVRCADWMFVPSISPSGWVVEAEEVEFFGVRIRERLSINFDVNNLITTVPATAVEQLLRDGVLVEYGRLDNLVYYVLPRKCNGSEIIRLHISGYAIELSKALLPQDFPTGDRCYINLAVEESSPHYKRPVMTIGMTVLTERCIGFDYERGMVGFGRRREQIAYPHLPDIPTSPWLRAELVN